VPGPDEIHPEFLKHLVKHGRESLYIYAIAHGSGISQMGGEQLMLYQYFRK
jgi:hypothetical protein